MLYDYKVGGTSDSPHGEPDRLGFHIYAEAVSKVVRAVENPNSSLCVGLFAPWGSGKTFFYNLIKDDLVKTAEAMHVKVTENKEEPTVLGVSSMLACNSWYYFALGLTKLLVSMCRCKSADPNSIATVVLLSFPIGISIWIIIFLSCLLVLTLINLPSHCCKWNVLKKISSYLLGKGKNDEESQGGISTYEKWNHVCSLLTGKIDLFTEERSFRNFQTMLLLCGQMSYQGLASLAPSLACPILNIFHEPYEVNEAMTKYIFVQFNVRSED